MAMKLYRCTSPGHEGYVEFACEVGKQVKCPKCVACRDNPRYARLIVELALIHFDGPGELPGYGAGHAACNPEIKIPNAKGDRATGEPVAVTCPECKATDLWKQTMAHNGLPIVPSDADFDYLKAVNEARAAKAPAVPVPVE